jgi:hypothetical protein
LCFLVFSRLFLSTGFILHAFPFPCIVSFVFCSLYIVHKWQVHACLLTLCSAAFFRISS